MYDCQIFKYKASCLIETLSVKLYERAHPIYVFPIMASKQRKELSLQDKIKLINTNKSRSQRQLADEFGIGKSQVQPF